MKQENKCCVYLHKRKDTGEVFYVGQGNSNRPYVRYRKLKAWNKIVDETGGFDVEIVKADISKEEALTLEEATIKQYADTVVNLPHTSSRTKELDFEYFNNKFYIDPTSPSNLSYKVDVYAGVNLRSLMIKAGSHCLSKCPDGSWQLSDNHKCLKTHRVVYLLAHGKISSEMIIDHINGNPSDNRIENLREITMEANRRNTAMHRGNTSGVSGISVGKNGIYTASVKTLDNKRLTKTFSINKYGKEEAFRLACNWRSTQIALLNDQGAGYTSRHGQ